MASEMRTERCVDCNGDRDREWITKLVSAGTPVPKGWRVSPTAYRSKTWKTIEARTRWTTLCECDATE